MTPADCCVWPHASGGDDEGRGEWTGRDGASVAVALVPSPPHQLRGDCVRKLSETNDSPGGGYRWGRRVWCGARTAGEPGRKFTLINLLFPLEMPCE